MASLSKVLPLTASCLSPLPGSNPGQRFQKAASDFGLGAGYSSFLHQLQLASHDLAAIWQKR